MTQNMIPSQEPITKGQIGDLCDKLGARIRKDEKNFPTNVVQIVIENHIDKFVEESLSALKKLVDAVSKIIVRHVHVKRAQSAQQALDATGRKQYTNKNVVATMPNGIGNEAEIHFIKFGEYVKCSELNAKLEALGYQLVDPFALAKVNEDDPAFADEHPNCTQWKDGNGNYCCAVFDRRGGGRYLNVGQDGNGWGGGWWFACVRISTSN